VGGVLLRPKPMVMPTSEDAAEVVELDEPDPEPCAA
jgi:hypothetical protein